MPVDLTASEAAALLRPTDSLGVPLGPGQPTSLLHALGERTDWVALDVLCAMLADFYEFPNRAGVRTISTFFGPAERIYRDAGADIAFVPADYRRWAPIMAERAPRVMCTAATPPDAQGWMSLSCHAGSTVDELHRAAADPDRLVLVEVGSNFPRTHGLGDHYHRLHVDEADVLIHTDRDLVSLADAAPSEVDLAIAARAAEFVVDGSTLQTGFGSIPSTIATALAAGPRQGLGIHSEMFTTGLMRLHQAGKVTNRHKGVFDGVSVTTFAAGVPELYEWLDERTDVAFLPVDVVNEPRTIAANRDMVTINGAITVDLWGQIVADTISAVQFSGIGGHEDFVSGGGHQRDDRSLICLPSCSIVGSATGTERVSRIAVSLPPGSIVTTPRHQADVIITEYGAAELRGLTVGERARALAEIAHPDFRDQLRAAAEPLR